MSFPTTPLLRIPSPNPTVPPPIHALTFSQGSGSYLLTGSQDRKIRLYSPTSAKSPAKPIQIYAAHGYEVLDIAVSSDNSRFVSVGGDKIVFLWDVATATTLRRFSGHGGRVQCCAFGGVGGEGGGESVVFSGSFDGTVKVWDLRSRNEKAVQTFSEARDAVADLAVHAEGFWAGSTDGRVRWYDLRRGVVETDVLGQSVTSVHLGRDGGSYLVQCLGGVGRLIDAGTGKCLQTFKDPAFKNDNYRIRSCLGMNDGMVLCGDEEGKVWVWDVLSGQVKHELWHRDGGDDQEGKKGRDVVSVVAWNQIRKQWASAGGDGTVVVWGASDGG